MTEQTTSPAAPQLKTCRCTPGCTATTKGNFAQGHDARMVSDQVAQILVGDQRLEGAAQLIREAGGTEFLVGKLHAAVIRATDQRLARHRARQDRLRSLAQAVMDHANEHYNDGGWDVIVETQSIIDLEQELEAEGINSVRAAIRHFKNGTVAIWADRQAEADHERRLAAGDEA